MASQYHPGYLAAETIASRNLHIIQERRVTSGRVFPTAAQTPRGRFTPASARTVRKLVSDLAEMSAHT